MIKTKNVTKVFSSKNKSVTAVANASFEVAQGEIFGLIGTNGAGKTTLIRMIASVIAPTEGEIFVLGKNVQRQGAATRKNIGILFGGEAGLYDRLTAYENIAYFAGLNGMDADETDRRIKELAEFFNMQDYLYRPCGKFSKGMKQKVCFARAIVHNPPIMLFDEPTSGLDILAAEEVITFIKQMKKQNKAVILSSHDMAEVTELCDRLLIIDKGQTKDTGTVPGLIEKYGKNTLKEVFFELTAAKEGAL